MTNIFFLIGSLETALKEAAPRTAAWEVRMILKAVLGRGLVEVQAEGGGVTSEEEARALEMVRRRVAGEPLAYVLGDAAFRELELKVGPGVLIPRVETELLVEAAVGCVAKWVRKMRESLSASALGSVPAPAPPIDVLDLGTGSGCIPLAIASAASEARVDAVERSVEALAYARANRAACGEAIEARVALIQMDYMAESWAERLKPVYHVIVANPPYISEADWAALPVEVKREPREALVGGPNGDEILRWILWHAPRHLAAGGSLILEIGVGQSKALCAYAESLGLRSEQVILDHQSIERILIFKKP